MEGQLFVISGPSGAGKGTIYNSVLERVKGILPSISVTTREPRGSEADGVEYFFVSEQKFGEMIRNDEFLEYAEVFGHRYGTPKKHVTDIVAKGGTVMLEIDVRGAAQIKRKFPSCVAIFIMPPSLGTLEERLRGRGTDKEESIKRRLSEAKRELSSYKMFDYIVFNDKLEEAIGRTIAIIEAESSRISRNETQIQKLLNE